VLSTVGYLRLAIVMAAGAFLYFLTRLAVELLTGLVYARLLRDLRGWERKQAVLEESRRFLHARR